MCPTRTSALSASISKPSPRPLPAPPVVPYSKSCNPVEPRREAGQQSLTHLGEYCVHVQTDVNFRADFSQKGHILGADRSRTLPNGPAGHRHHRDLLARVVFDGRRGCGADFSGQTLLSAQYTTLYSEGKLPHTILALREKGSGDSPIL